MPQAVTTLAASLGWILSMYMQDSIRSCSCVSSPLSCGDCQPRVTNPNRNEPPWMPTEATTPSQCSLATPHQPVHANLVRTLGTDCRWTRVPRETHGGGSLSSPSQRRSESRRCRLHLATSGLVPPLWTPQLVCPMRAGQTRSPTPRHRALSVRQCACCLVQSQGWGAPMTTEVEVAAREPAAKLPAPARGSHSRMIHTRRSSMPQLGSKLDHPPVHQEAKHVTGAPRRGHGSAPVGVDTRAARITNASPRTCWGHGGALGVRKVCRVVPAKH